MHGLTGGADDYLAKPFQVSELVARVELRLRDHQQHRAEAAPAAEALPLRAGAIELDAHARTAMVGDRRVDLSAREFMLAELFVTHAGTVLSRDQILERVWGPDSDGRSNVVEVYVGTCARSSARNRSRRCAAWATGCFRIRRSAEEPA